MKRCPECGREYDLSMSFCLDDGTELLYGPRSEPGAVSTGFLHGEPATAILSGYQAAGMAGESSETPTRAFDAAGMASDPGHRSIAVLPFVNMSADVDSEFFCDGLAEELLNALTKIEHLKVAARTSAFSFKGTNAHVSEIGRALGVSSVLDGSVRRAGDRVRITVQMVSASDGYHIWSERYDREVRDIFALQDEITLAVVDALKVRLLGVERSAILKKATDDPEAYEQYLRGRALWNRRTPSDFEKAIHYFEKAIEIDPGYSLANSGIADCYALLAYFEQVAPGDLREQAKMAAVKAIQLDEESADANCSMAMYRLIFEFDLLEAGHRFRRAVELNPKLVTARYLRGTYLATQGRFDEAFAEHRIALELDPLSQPLNGNVSRALYMGRRYTDAIKLAEKNLEIAPEFSISHYVLGVSYRQLGHIDKALDHSRKAVSLSGFFSFKGEMGVTLAMAGRRTEALEVLSELESVSTTRYVSAQWPAVIHAALGDSEAALTFLERAFDARAIQLLWLAVDPAFDPLRGEPRFKEILRRMNLPE